MLSQGFLLTEGIICIVGSVCNLGSAVRIWKTFNLNLAPYFIMFIGSCYTCIASLGSLFAIIHLLVFGNEKRFWCAGLVVPNSVAALLASGILGLLSVLR